MLTLSAIACDRFIAVIFPLRARLGKRKARLVPPVSAHHIWACFEDFIFFRYFIFFNWIVSGVVASPFLKYRIVTEIQVNFYFGFILLYYYFLL